MSKAHYDIWNVCCLLDIILIVSKIRLTEPVLIFKIDRINSELIFEFILFLILYRGANMSLARPERKQATATEDFDVLIPYLLS
jgi:hypothetical protein